MAKLVGKDNGGFRLVNRSRKFAQRLRHQACLDAHGRVAHVAFNFRTGDEGGNRVDDNQVNRARTHECLGDFKRLFACIRLGDEELVNHYAAFGSINWIERVFHVDISCRAAASLAFSHNMLAKRGFARRFRTVNFGDAGFGDAADAKRHIQRERAGWDGFHLHLVRFTEAHDASFAVFLDNVM